MRISSSLLFQTGLNSINAQQSDLMHLFQQIGSGRRMVTPADDPLGASQAINIRQSQTLNARYAENRNVANINLGTEENTLNTVTLLMQDIKTRLVEAGNGTMSDADRKTLATVLKDARTNMLNLANATDGNGQYLFSGSKGATAAFSDAGEYLGDNAQRLIQVDQTRQMESSDVGSDVFARATPGITTYVTAAGTVFGQAAANAGTGIISTASVYDASQTNPNYSFQLQFENADAADPASPVVYRIVVLDGDGNTVEYDSAELGFGWKYTHSYDPDGENLIKMPFGVQVKMSGAPQAGDTFSVESAASTNMNIFNTLDSVIAALDTPHAANPAAQAHFQNVLASAIQRIDINYDNVLTVRSSIGARMNELEALDANGALRDLAYRQQISSLEDLDYYTATTQLELRKSALEGATLAFRKIQSISLFAIGSGR